MLTDGTNAILHFIYDKCPKGGDAHSSTEKSLFLATATARAFWELSYIRDGLDSAKYGFASLEIDKRRKRAIIQENEQSRLNTIRREHRNIEWQQTLANKLRQYHIDSATRARFEYIQRELLDSAALTLRPGDYTIKYEVSDKVYTAYFELGQHEQNPGLFPSDWDLEAYSIGQFRDVLAHLKTDARIHEMFFRYWQAATETLAPPGGAELFIDREQVVKRALRLSGVPRGATLEVLRDLTYDVDKVAWSDVDLQPLLPLARIFHEFSSRTG